MIQIYILFVQNLQLFTSLIRAVIYRLAYQLLFFIAGLFVAALSGTELFGIISLMIVNAAAFIVITDFGTGASLIWHGSGNEMRRERLFSFAAWSGFLQLLLFIFVELIAIKISGKTLLARQPFNGFYVFIDLIYFAGLIIADKYTSLLYGHHKAVLANKILSVVVGAFVAVFVLMYARIVSGIDPLTVFCVMIFALGLSQAIVFHVAVSTITIGKPDNKELKSLISFSGIVFITNIFQFLAYRIDFWLVDHFYTHSDLGIYSQANRFAQLVWILPTIIASLLAPALRNTNYPLSEKSFLTVTRVLNLLTVFVALSIIVIASFFYYWFFPPDYAKGLPALLLMLPGYLLFATTTVLAAWFSAKRLLKINLIGSSVCFLIILTSDLLLIPAYSLRGAAIANTIAYSITTWYFVLQFKRYTSVELKDLFLWRRKDIFALKTYVR